MIRSATVLVTGGAGFIGSSLLRYLLAERPGWSIINYDALTYAGNPANLEGLEASGRYRFIRGDIRDGARLRAALRGVDLVIHLAAESHVDRSIADACPFMSTNVLGTQTLLDACRAAGGIERIVHVSTDEVYGALPLEASDERFTEDSPLRPTSPYAASKAASDLVALAWARTYGLHVCVTRASNNHGPRQFPEKVIPLFCTNLIDGCKVPLYGDGRNVRDWMHVDDHCSALLAVAEAGRRGGIYNVGADNERSNLELTHQLLALFGAGPEMIEPVRDRPGHDLRYAVDASRLREELGWRPRHSVWPESLRRTVQWYRDHEAWWRPLKDRAFNATMLEPVAPRGARSYSNGGSCVP
jgi:dTDP-glucose 4,6-dehydratase